MRPLIDKLEQEWKAPFPRCTPPLSVRDDQVEQLYVAESNQQQLIWVASGLAILISCLGLFGLTATILSNDLLKLLAESIALASPFAWRAMNKWLEDFAYRIDIQWWMFAAGLASVAIALLTVSWQAIGVVLANPVDSLRDE